MFSEDPAVVQFDDQTPGEVGPPVDLGYWKEFVESSDGQELKGAPANPLAVDPSTPETTQAEVLKSWDEFRTKAAIRAYGQEVLLSGVEKVYSTQQVAADFFGKSNQWMYWGLRTDPGSTDQIFAYKDGSPILPERVGKMGKRRFSLPIIREIALSCFRRGNLTEEELLEIMAKILHEEFGEQAFADAK